MCKCWWRNSILIATAVKTVKWKNLLTIRLCCSCCETLDIQTISACQVLPFLCWSGFFYVHQNKCNWTELRWHYHTETHDIFTYNSIGQIFADIIIQMTKTPVVKQRLSDWKEKKITVLACPIIPQPESWLCNNEQNQDARAAGYLLMLTKSERNGR